MAERWRASGPDGAVTFMIAVDDQTPLEMAARRALARQRGVSPDMVSATFTSIEPTNETARQVIDHAKPMQEKEVCGE